MQAANHLTDSLKAMGIELRRFKTGTPARMDKRSLDFSKMEDSKKDTYFVLKNDITLNSSYGSYEDTTFYMSCETFAGVLDGHPHHVVFLLDI